MAMMRQARAGLGMGMIRAAIVAVALGTAPATAQLTTASLPLANAYGSGVHAFFSGDFDRSFADLTAAIDGGTADPRAWYFRGLAASRMGRFDEAEADFREGADRELAAVGNWPVSKSLERVQGAERLRLERHRTRARVAAIGRDREMIRRRYVEIEEAQPEVLRKRRPLPAAEAGNDVFSTPAERVPAPAAVEPAPAVAPEAAAEPADAPADAPAEEPDPFAADQPAAADPAERVEAEPLEAEKPLEAEQPAEADDFRL